MKKILNLLAASALSSILLPALWAQDTGFTDSHVSFYGKVRQVGGGGTTLLQSGQLEMTFSSASNPENRVTLQTSLQPTGTGNANPYSYLLKAPLAYLPAAPRLNDYLAIGEASTDFRVESIAINGQPATLLDGSIEFYGLSFANRAERYRLDLLVTGDSNDSDGDELPDWWENLHGLDPLSADADDDLDGDGWSNRLEFARGTNPRESNIEPELATSELVVPELGEAGCLLQFHDSDSSAEEISLTLEIDRLQGFAVKLDGTLLVESPVILRASTIREGRLSVSHLNPAIRSTSLPVSWNDGGESRSSAVEIRTSTPSTSSGNDASLWLDAASLTIDESLSVWNDRSGNGRNAMQPLEENQPLTVVSGNLRGVLFDTPRSHLFFPDEAIPSGDHTILAVWRSPDSHSDSQFLLSSNRGFLRLEPTGEAVSYPGAPFYQANEVAVRGYESSPGEISTTIFRRQDSSIQSIFGLSYNGEEIEAEPLQAVLPTIGVRRLALPLEDPLNDGFSGSLNELIIFPTALPEQKLRDVHDYLQSKWSGHIIWDFSTSLRPTKLAITSQQRNIIRGGHGDDDLGGEGHYNILSGGPGNDILRGGSGTDTFVFGGIDTGDDLIVDFDPENDVIDLSALFWGKSGDARQYLSSRLDTRFDTPVPTLDTVLILQRPDGSVQEIALQDTIFDVRKMIELIVEGRIRMGGLTIPTEVSLALASGSQEDTVLRESEGESFTVEVTRTGDGAAGALEVPLGLFRDALGDEVILEGDVSKSGQRAEVRFDRGETSKLINFRPVQDLETEGPERWETAVLPHFRYTIAGGPVARSVSDDPMVHLMVTTPNALTTGQPARVSIIRDGNPADALTVNLELNGTAMEGTHINSVPRTITIPAGQLAAELTVTTKEGWDGAMTRMALLSLSPNDRYLVGNPHEATIYAAGSAPDPEASGFDRWLAAATEGEITTVIDLLRSEHADRFRNLLRAYAAGQSGTDALAVPGLTFRLVENQPVLSAPLSTSAADLRWEVHDADLDNGWRDVSSSFSQELSGDGLTLIGPPRGEGEHTKLYRLVFTVDQGSQLDRGIERFTSSTRYGVRGASAWRTDPTTGNLTSVAGTSGATSRLIVEINEPTLLEFDLSIEKSLESGSLAFYINGEQVAETTGDPVEVRRQVNPERPVLLMWEFQGDSGRAVISNPAPADTAGQE
ncbi:MAG TPA: hypothetical protein DIV39_11940 [Verrucomicrobiales bacterium]|nr:hypothetical protein [Verrucomicrobiales bacterium]